MANQAFKTARTLLRGAFGVVWAYFAYLILREMVGHSTSVLVSILVSTMANVRVALGASLVAALAGWGYGERRLRKRQIERWHPRIKELETLLDAGRSTSTLTVRGETNPADKGV